MIIFMYGENDFLAKRTIEEFKLKFLKEVDKTGSSLSFLDASLASIGDISRMAGASSLLAEKRMLVLENMLSNKSKDFVEEALKYFESHQKTDNIIIVYEPKLKTETKNNTTRYIKINTSSKNRELLKKEQALVNFLEKQKFSFKEFKKLENISLTNFIKKEFKNRGADISNQAAYALGGLVAGDLWQLDNEINKLINYSRGTKEKAGARSLEIGEADVIELVKGQVDANIFALTDAISTRNRALANKLLEEQYSAGLSDSYLLTMIIRQVKILLQIREALDNGMASGQVAKILKIHPFVVQKGIGQARSFDLKTLKRLLDYLVETDYKMKTGQASVRTLLNILLSKV